MLDLNYEPAVLVEDITQLTEEEWLRERTKGIGGSAPEEVHEYDELLDSVLRKYPKTDGMFLSSDVMAAQALQVCRKLHISVPDQMKIIGFDDVNIASLTTPQLTTIHQPIKEMAEITLNLLQDSASGKLVAKRTILPVCLIERETT